MKVSVVVATWNGLHLLPDCLRALQQQTLAHELVIVDNGSQDGTLDWLATHAPYANVIALPANRGFAGGYNAGMRAASGEYLVLINNDAIAAPDLLQNLVGTMPETDRVAAVGGVLTFAHRPEIVASGGIVPSCDGLHRDLFALEPTAALPGQPLEIFGASGGAVCLRRAALDDVGLFDEGFFNYLEDADLAWRLRLRDWRTLLAPGARARHIYSATSIQGSPFKQRLLARNRVRVIVRCLPGSLLRKHWWRILRYDLLATAYGLLRRQPAIVAGRLAAVRELPALWQERRALQARRLASDATLERWLQPAVSVRQMLAEQRALAKLIAEQ